MLTDIELQKKLEILTNKLKIGLFKEVIDETKLLLKKRKHQVLYNLLSLPYQSLGQNDKSVEIMEAALKINSRNPHFLNNIGSEGTVNAEPFNTELNKMNNEDAARVTFNSIKSSFENAGIF